MRDDCFNHKMIVATSTYVNEGCAALRLPDSEDLCAANWTGTLGGWAPVLKSNCLRVTDRPFSPALEAIRLHSGHLLNLWLEHIMSTEVCQ